MPGEEIFLFNCYDQKNSDTYISLSTTALKHGFFAGWTGDQLALFFLLLAYADQDLTGRVDIDKLQDRMPAPASPPREILAGLEEAGAVEIEGEGNFFSYHLNLQAVNRQSRSSTDDLEQEERFLRELLSGRPVSEQELVKGLVLILAPEKLTGHLRQEIEEIMTSFHPELVRELIRRVKKALEDNPDLKPLPYLRAIVREWIKNGIKEPEDLQNADRLHRETYELAMEFGLSRAWEMSPSHREVLLSWITARDDQDFALSVEVARWAIQEAMRSKRDGRPSLNYIERNFIQPLKNARVSCINEAQEALAQKETAPPEEISGWDFEKYRDD